MLKIHSMYLNKSAQVENNGLGYLKNKTIDFDSLLVTN